MKVIYTTCTYNHISRALSLGDSVDEYCPGSKFIIGLIDDANPNTDLNLDTELLQASELGISFLQEMRNKYDILELNAALKPYFANHIFNNRPEVNELIYLDSDILLFDNLDVIYESLGAHSIILTPHSLSSVKRGFSFDDRNFLRSGIYNIGFYAVKRDSNGLAFLAWWMDKLRDEGFIDSKRGMFAEQLWLNLVPIYFEKVYIMRHIGCNVAYWNLHERKVFATEKGYLINGETPLIFYHFSGASITCLEDNNLSNHQNRYSFTNRPDVLPLFEKYVASLKKHNFEQFSAYYSISAKLKTKSRILIFIIENAKKVVKRILYQK